MKENQAGIKQEAVQSQEPKRPLLLTVTITWGILHVFILYLVELLNATIYEPRCNLNWVGFLV